MPEFKAKNHYLSQFHLEQWKKKHSNKVCCYKLLVSHNSVPNWSKVPVSGTAYQPHLYTQSVDGNQIDELERWLESEIETPANLPFKKILDHIPLTQKEWNKIIRYLALQDCRTPDSFFKHKEFAEKELPNIQNEVLTNAVNKLESGYFKNNNEKYKSQKNIKRFPSRFITRPDITDPKLVNIGIETTPGRATWLYFMKDRLTRSVENFTIIIGQYLSQLKVINGR